MSRRDFTGERLHTADELFSVDLARHRAAYEFARTRGDDGWLLDLGSGSGAVALAHPQAVLKLAFPAEAAARLVLAKAFAVTAGVMALGSNATAAI